MDEKSLLSPEDQAVLRQVRQMNAKPSVQQMYDTLKFKDSEKRVEGLTRGNYYIESYDGSKPDGERKIVRDIGPNPEMVILHRVYTYSQYVEGQGLKAWTSDITGFSEQDMVTLYAIQDGKRVEEFIGSYPELKIYMAQHYITHHPDGRDEKLMTFQNLLYVLFEGKVYRMFVSNASAAGIAPGAKGGDFKNPQPKSLLSFIDSTHEQQGSALCEYICRLASWFKDDVEQPFYIRTFENMGENPNLPEAIAQVKLLLLDSMRQQKEIAEKRNISDLRQESIVKGRPEIVDAEELPF